MLELVNLSFSDRGYYPNEMHKSLMPRQESWVLLFPPAAMGNSTSTHLPPHSRPKRRFFWQKRSHNLSFPSLGCISAANHSTESIDHIQETSKLVLNEKAVLVDLRDQQISPTSQVGYAAPAPSLAVYSPTLNNVHVETDTEVAYQNFLKSYPGTSVRSSVFPCSPSLEYRLTWILDTLRRTDFARLERADETYVDYMGGSLYPESLIRVHTEFLSQHILGNTHSISNT